MQPSIGAKIEAACEIGWIDWSHIGEEIIPVATIAPAFSLGVEKIEFISSIKE